MLKPGILGTSDLLVTEAQTAKAYGSGELRVFATPAMIALMEKTCLQSVASALSEGEGTVGTRLDVRHLSPTLVGQRVTCQSELIEVDRRRLVFSVRVFDACGLIGEGRHERFVIQNEPFMKKAAQKAAL